MTKKRVLEIIDEIYVDLYKAASPSADWDVVKHSTEEGWFYNYTIPLQVLIDIIDRHLKKNKVPKMWQSDIAFNVHLGPSPKVCT